MDEARIIQQSTKGKRSAQRKLYEMHRVRWFMICKRYVRFEQDAMDVLQNSLVKIYRGLPDFDPEKGSFRAWSSRIVVNECLMFIRKVSGQRTNSEKYMRQVNIVGNETAHDKLSAEEIVNLIRALPEGYRTVFNLFAIEGYTHDEIASMLNISPGTSKSQLFKARRMLQDQIQELFEIVHP